MDGKTVAFTTLLSVLPISELRGAIPYALARGVSVPVALVYCIVLNALVGPIVYLFLNTLHKLLSKIPAYSRLFERIVSRARSKVEAKIQRYGYLGLTLFVAIPLPITGAYTGALGAWILGMDAKKTFLAVALGVLIAGCVVTLVAYLGIEALSIFVKQVQP